MRTRSLALILVAASSLLAQDSSPSGKFPGFEAQARGAVKLLPNLSHGLTVNSPPAATVVPMPSPSRCSVGLQRARIPQDVQYTIQQLTPRPNSLAPIPQARVPAPACESPAVQPPLFEPRIERLRPDNH